MAQHHQRDTTPTLHTHQNLVEQYTSKSQTRYRGLIEPLWVVKATTNIGGIVIRGCIYKIRCDAQGGEGPYRSSVEVYELKVMVCP